MSRVLVGKLGIITGGSRGIGAAIAENLASKGCDLVLNYTSAASTGIAKALAARLEEAHGIKTFLAQANLGTPEGPRQLVEMVRGHFAKPDGSFQIDIIINNAGIALNNKIPDIKIHEFEETYRVNVLGPLLLIQAAQPYLPTDRSGRIVNVSSVSAVTGFVGQSVYGGTKAAVEAMTRTWARELSERCTVNSINPGPVEGPMYKSNTQEFLDGIKGWILHTPLMKPRPGVESEEQVEDAKATGGRNAYPSEIAGIVGMLCTPDSAWCTGQVIQANGGMLMH